MGCFKKRKGMQVGKYNAGASYGGFFFYKLHGNFAVIIIEVTERLIHQNKIKGLLQRTDNGYALLLTIAAGTRFL